MSDRSVDLGILRVPADERIEDRVARSVMRQIRLRSTLETDAVALLGQWARPALAAATAVIVCGAALMFGLRRAQPAQPDTIAETLGVPTSLAHWVAGGPLETAALLDEMRGQGGR